MRQTGNTLHIFLLVCLSLCQAKALSQDYRFITFKTENELSQPYVYSIMQDSLGYLWIGTGKGLSKYDGFTFENHTVNDSLADDFISCSFGDGNDLWFGHMNGRVTYYHNKAFHKISTAGRDLSPVTHLAADTRGQTWFSTYGEGLFRIDREKLCIQSRPFTVQTDIHTFEFINDHEAFLGTGSGLLLCNLAGSDTIRSTVSIRNIPKTKITCILKKKSGPGYYISTENDGLFFVNVNKHNFNVTEIRPSPGNSFTGVQQILEDSRSGLWLATIGNGLMRLSMDGSTVAKITWFNKLNGYLTDNVKTVFEDREGIIWSGNYGDGLTQIIPNPFILVKLKEEIYGKNVTSVYASGTYQWIGTEKGLLKKDSKTGNIQKFYTQINGLPDDNITALFAANENDFWIGTGHSGLFCLNEKKGTVRPYPLGENSMTNAITQITGRDETLWVGTQKGLCRINTVNNEKYWFTINQGGLPHNFINSLYLDKKNILWVSTNSSTLASIKDNRVKRIELSGGKGLGEITEDKSFRIWIGSYGDGVFMIDKDSILNLNTKQGLLSNFCYSVTCDDQDNLWIGHRGGISRIRISDYSVKILQDPSAIPEECQFNRNAIFTDHETVLFGSDRGLYSYNRLLELPRKTAPSLVVTSIRIDDDEIDPETTDINLIPGSYKIKITFLGISLKNPSKVSYQYKLDGYDQWSEITRKNEVTYNKLTQGHFRFILKASDGDGNITQTPLTINIHIRIPVWKKWWFYAVLVTLMVVLIYTYIKWRLHRLIIANEILEEKVQKRTNEIECQKNELALQRDMIERKNASITSSIMYASQIQNAILPPEEFIDRLLPENFILNLPKDIVSGDFFWLAEKNNRIVFTVGDCTGHGVPGSFMSLLGITLISEIVNVLGIVESDEIVTTLRDMVIASLQQNRKAITTADGMDIALCVMDKTRNTIQFSGGMNDLVYIHRGNMEIIEADHISVSILYADFGKFSKKEIHFEKGDTIYLASDGFQDQFGGERDKKFLRQRFYSLLAEIHPLPMADQKVVLEKKLRDWMGSEVQTDDITVMGVRL